MPEETPVVDCHECKDLKWARNLAWSMKEGYGRHNSNRSFRDASHQLRYVSEYCYAWRDSYTPAILHIRENQQARVIGRVGDHSLRQKWEDCEVGDAVPESMAQHFQNLAHMDALTTIKCVSPPHPQHYWNPEETLPDIMDMPVERRTFERVAVEMCDSNGAWKTEYFWKRLS